MASSLFFKVTLVHLSLPWMCIFTLVLMEIYDSVKSEREKVIHFYFHPNIYCQMNICVGISHIHQQRSRCDITMRKMITCGLKFQRVRKQQSPSASLQRSASICAVAASNKDASSNIGNGHFMTLHWQLLLTHRQHCACGWGQSPPQFCLNFGDRDTSAERVFFTHQLYHVYDNIFWEWFCDHEVKILRVLDYEQTWGDGLCFHADDP